MVRYLLKLPGKRPKVMHEDDDHEMGVPPLGAFVVFDPEVTLADLLEGDSGSEEREVRLFKVTSVILYIPRAGHDVLLEEI